MSTERLEDLAHLEPHARITALENQRIEDDLVSRFAYLGEIRWDLDDDGLVYWTILGSVIVHRDILPSEGGTMTRPEDENIARHRGEILDLVKAAFDAGRSYQAPISNYDRIEVAAAAVASLPEETQRMAVERIVQRIVGADVDQIPVPEPDDDEMTPLESAELYVEHLAEQIKLGKRVSASRMDEARRDLLDAQTKAKTEAERLAWRRRSFLRLARAM